MQQSKQSIHLSNIVDRELVEKGASMRGVHSIGIVLAILLCLTVNVIILFPQESRLNSSTFVEQPCPFNRINAYQITCGTVDMPLDHDDPQNENTVTLAVAVIHSLSQNPEPDPVLYLEGGPGGADVGVAPIMPVRVPFLQTVLQSRDVILVDQRGMGLSRPVYHCSPYVEQSDIYAVDFVETYIERMSQCPQQFDENGIDWTKFTTRQNALDLSKIAKVLGYEQVNLYGISYGTLLGMIILRENPSGVRSVILDSVLTPTSRTFEQSAENMSNAFAKVINDCTNDTVCSLAYPNLLETFVDTHERILENDSVIMVEGKEISLNGFAEQVRLMLVSRAEIGRIPMFITAVANEDYNVMRPFIEQVLATKLEDFPNQALYMTMVCPHGIDGLTAESMKSAHEAFASPFGHAGFNLDGYAQCGAWGKLPDLDRSLPESDVPTLMLVGDYDPLTPNVWAQETLTRLTVAQLVSIPYTSHGTMSEACPRQIAGTFLDDPLADLDGTCLDEIAPPSFTLHISVTRPYLQIITLGLAIVVAGVLVIIVKDYRTYFNWIAWRFAFRRLSWMPIIAGIVLIVAIITETNFFPDASSQLTTVQYLVPLLMALLVATVFAPTDEPALEIQLSLPRPSPFILFERIIAVLLSTILVAAVGIMLTLARQSDVNVLSLVIGWIPPALFLSGIGLYVTLRTQVLAFGVVLTGFLWFIFGAVGSLLVPGINLGSALNLPHSFLWVFHVNASLADFAPQDFWLNRLFLTVVGTGFMVLSARMMNRTETLLLSGGGSRRKEVKTEQAHLDYATVTVNPVPVSIRLIAQITGIAWYEMKMIWRGRALKVLTITPLVGIGLFGLMYATSGQLFPGLNTAIPVNQDEVEILRGELLALLSSIFLFLQGFYLLPIMLADRVPTDSAVHVNEMFAALPVTGVRYLIGKMLGAIGAGLISIVITWCLSMVMWYLMVGSYLILPLIDNLLLLACGGMAYISVAVLVGASQPGNRRALLAVLFVLIVPPIVLGSFGFMSGANLLTINIDKILSNSLVPPIAIRDLFVGSGQFWTLCISLILQFLVIAILVLAWRRYQAHNDRRY